MDFLWDLIDRLREWILYRVIELDHIEIFVRGDCVVVAMCPPTEATRQCIEEVIAQIEGQVLCLQTESAVYVRATNGKDIRRLADEFWAYLRGSGLPVIIR